MPLKVGELSHVEVFCPSQFCEQLTSLISNLGRNLQTVSLFAGTGDCDIVWETLGQLDYLAP